MKKLFTSLVLAAVLAASSFTSYAAPLQTAEADALTPSAQAVALVNKERKAVGLPALAEDMELDAVSCVRAGEMDAAFSHIRPDGTQWYTAFDAADASRFTKVSIGENLAKGYPTADETVAAWMNSPEHKANILRADYQYIGMACVQVDGIIYWVCEFAG